MCNHCDWLLDTCEYFQDSLTGDWYHEVKTSAWDDCENDWVYEKEWGVGYCQYCGRELK